MEKPRVGYLGPEGSFGHEAVSTLSDVEPVACRSIADILSAVADGSVDLGLVPWKTPSKARSRRPSMASSSITTS